MAAADPRVPWSEEASHGGFPQLQRLPVFDKNCACRDLIDRPAGYSYTRHENNIKPCAYPRAFLVYPLRGKGHITNVLICHLLLSVDHDKTSIMI